MPHRKKYRSRTSHHKPKVKPSSDLSSPKAEYSPHKFFHNCDRERGSHNQNIQVNVSVKEPSDSGCTGCLTALMALFKH